MVLERDVQRVSETLQALLSVDEALELVLAAFARLPAEEITIADGLGRVLAQDVRADQSLPPFANSGMDGYAVRAADVSGATRTAPVRLDVIGDIPAGSSPKFNIAQGQAARIMTGAPIDRKSVG